MTAKTGCFVIVSFIPTEISVTLRQGISSGSDIGINAMRFFTNVGSA
jgi:hypothetical protein